MKKPTKTKLSAAVYLRAAQLIKSGREIWGCCAIDKVTGIITDRCQDNPNNHLFMLVTMPEDGGYAWYGTQCSENTEARILGLLLCAALVRDGWEVADFVEAGK
jgi:hypothetical protein